MLIRAFTGEMIGALLRRQMGEAALRSSLMYSYAHNRMYKMKIPTVKQTGRKSAAESRRVRPLAHTSADTLHPLASEAK